jgi:HK97 family phage major capsid protein
MTKLTVPTDPDGLRALLTDSAKLKEYFSREAVGDGTTKEFLDAYAAQYVQKNPELVNDMKTQVQSVLFDMLRDGGGKGPLLDLAGNGKAPVSFRNGRPTLGGPETSPRAVSKGRGAIYNRAAPGARFEEKYREEDRFHSIGEYCQAIREEARPSSRSDRKTLLQKLDNVRSFMNSFGSEEPSAGGFLIPEVMRSELLQLALEDTIVRSRATVIPMSTLSVPIPTVDDTSHVTSLFGGVVYYWAEEAASIPESQAAFEKVTLTAKKLAGFFKVPNELLGDAPAFSAWFDTRIPAGLAWFEDLAFMTETGVGTPLGFINCPASVAVAAQAGQPTQTIVLENIAAMYSRMLPTSLKNAVWIASIDTFPQLATMALSVGTGGAPVWLAGGMTDGVVQAPPMTIYGRPVYFTEKTPALGTTGDISFVDLSYYLIGDRQSVEVASSEHAFFQNDQTAFRIIERVDGRPWLQSALTPHNNSANTLSAFVQLASR